MLKTRIKALLIVLLGVGLGFFVYYSEINKDNSEPSSNKVVNFISRFPFKLGLDLSGGSHLIYKADLSNVEKAEVSNSMNSLRDIIERRVNIFGVAEPMIQVQEGSFTNNYEERLIVDLPGVTDVSEAIKMIGQTPMLDFRTEVPKEETEETEGEEAEAEKLTYKVNEAGQLVPDYDSLFQLTDLTGRFLDKAVLNFDQTTGEAMVSLQFDKEGADLFKQMTTENVGKTIAIFLDGYPISIPVVNEAIPDGQAIISGNFTPKEAKELVDRLNSGALPVPISLVSTQTIGASLGDEATQAGVFAALVGFLAVAIFFILWFRLPGVIAVLALSIYTLVMLSIFKLVPVVLTATGIAGFIISIGMAVDANVLIFERIKEELREDKEDLATSIRNGFKRAWLSVRDSNISTIITSIILYSFGTTLIKGFALVLLIGVVTSLISAVLVSRLFLYSLNFKRRSKLTEFMFGSGFTNAKQVIK
jgi:preprotein translocase subunit SecD